IDRAEQDLGGRCRDTEQRCRGKCVENGAARHATMLPGKPHNTTQRYRGQKNERVSLSIGYGCAGTGATSKSPSACIAASKRPVGSRVLFQSKTLGSQASLTV